MTHRFKLEVLEDRSLPAFLAPVEYPVGVAPTAVKVGDFNNDGVQDLVTLDTGTYSVSVLLGNPGGTFRPARSSYAGNGYPLSSLAVGDFNEDGKLDLATGSNLYEPYQYGVDDVIVLLGNGDGTFGPPDYLGTNLPALSVVTGDLNGDDNLDLVATSWNDASGSSVSVLLGGGDGTFARATTYGPDYVLPSPALADFNGDGNTDLAGGHHLFLGNGDGTLQEPSDLGIFSFSWTVADFDRDGVLDLAGATFDGGDDGVSVLLGNGNGSFQAAQFFPAGLRPDFANAADMNRDGVLDLVVTNQPTDGADGGLTVLLGDGDGSFAPPITTTVAGYPGSLVLADFNANGLPDAAVTNSGTDTVSVLFNDGTWPPDDSPSVGIRDLTITEGNTGTVGATFTVTLSHTSNVDVTVHYATANITATAGSDYTATSGTVIIPAGQISATVEIAVRGDRLGEANETFAVNLSAATNATIADGQGIGTILDNEPHISITDVSKTEGRKGSTTLFTFTIVLSVPYDQPVTVSFQTVNGTATTGDNDYVARTGTLTFAPGETTKTITIEVKGDNKRESNEMFYLDLTGNSSNSWITKRRGIGTILNDD